MRLYKVKHVSTRLFWNGGDLPRLSFGVISEEDVIGEKFGPNGKTWSKIQYLEAALRNVTKGLLQKILIDECEIVEYVAEPTFSVVPNEIDKLKKRVKHVG